MSVDYDAVLVVGCCMDVESFFRPLMERRREKSHMEPRFDPTTGEQTDPVKVVDQPAGWDIVLDKITHNGERFEGPEAAVKKNDDTWGWEPEQEILDVLERMFDCSVSTTGDYQNGEYFVIAFEPKELKKYTIDEICSLRDECYRIAKDIRSWGLEIGEPGVSTITSIS